MRFHYSDEKELSPNLYELLSALNGLLTEHLLHVEGAQVLFFDRLRHRVDVRPFKANRRQEDINESPPYQ